MKISVDDLKKYTKILKKTKLPELDRRLTDYTIGFPLDMTQVVDDDGFELVTKGSDSTTGKPTPVLLISNEYGERGYYTSVSLAYCDVTYSQKFDFVEFERLNGLKCDENMKDKDCVLVNYKNIFIATVLD